MPARETANPPRRWGIKLKGPSRRIGLVGLIVVLLLPAGRGVRLWRYGVATSGYDEALRKDAAVALIGAATDNLLDAAVSVNLLAVPLNWARPTKLAATAPPPPEPTAAR